MICYTLKVKDIHGLKSPSKQGKKRCMHGMIEREKERKRERERKMIGKKSITATEERIKELQL